MKSSLAERTMATRRTDDKSGTRRRLSDFPRAIRIRRNTAKTSGIECQLHLNEAIIEAETAVEKETSASAESMR
jgi:hypothetical protein